MGGFRGDLSTLGLADIFQTLSNSQKEGTLVVGDGESRKCIYFGKEGLSLLSIGSRKGLRIGDLLLKSGKISADQLRDLLSAQKGTGKKLGEIIVDRGIATEEDITNLIRTQIEDEIFDLFNWKKASFEFIDGPPSPELSDVDRPVTSLKFDVNSLLFEASRRIDEWTLINQAIPSVNTIFILTEAGEKLVEASEDSALRTIAKLTDASRTVDQIVDESGQSRFSACKALYTLLTQNGIRQVSQDELTAMGKRLAYQGERDRAVRILACAVDLNHGNLVPQQELALVLRQAGMNDEAFGRYFEMGKIWEERGRQPEAIQAFKQALEVKPEAGDAAFRLFRLHCTTKNNGDALKMGEQLFPALLGAGDRQRAREVGEYLATCRPTDTDLRLRVAALCQDLGDQEACGRHLATAIDHLPPGSVDVEGIARKVLQVLPNRTDIRFKVERIFAERRAHRKKAAARLGVFAGIGVIVIGIALFVLYEMKARKAWADIEREAQALVAEKKWDDARAKYAEIRSRFKMSLIAGKATDRIAEVDTLKAKEDSDRVAADQERRLKEAEAIQKQQARLVEAKALWDAAKPDLPQAKKIYEEVLKWGEERNIESLRAEAGAGLKRVSEYLQDAGSLADTAAEFLKNGQVEGAHSKVQQLRKEYPKSPQAQTTKLPYLVSSVPPGAQIFVGEELVGLTPKVVSVSPDGGAELAIRMKTFKEERRPLSPGQSHVTIEMKKELLWRVQIGAVETTPVVEGGHIIVAMRDRKVFALDIGNQETIWKYETNHFGQFQASPVLAGGKLYFGANDGVLYCINELGKKDWSVVLANQSSIKGSPALSADGTTLYIGCNDGKFYARDARSGSSKWEVAVGKPVRSRPYVGKDRVYFGADDGKLHAVDFNGNVIWAYSAGGLIGGPIVAYNSYLVAGSDDGTLHMVDLDGKEHWKYKADKGIKGGACISGDLAVFGTVGGPLVAVNLKTQKPVWEFKDPTKAIQGTPVIGDDAVYVGSDDGYLYSVELKTGLLRWKYRTEDAIVGSPVLAGNGKNYIFVGSEDKYLYALER